MAPAGRAFLEIAHQADADAAFVHFLGPHVAAVDLPGPARAHLDLPVARVAAVADHEVVGEAVFHAAPAVGAVVGAGVAGLDAAVVHDKVGPASRRDAQSARCRQDGGERAGDRGGIIRGGGGGPARGGSGDHEALAGPELRGAQPVARL